MKITIKKLFLFLSLLILTGHVHARSYGFLVEAIKEYQNNPNIETEAKLDAAQSKANTIDTVFLMTPIALGVYVFLRILLGTKKHTPKRISVD